MNTVWLKFQELVSLSINLCVRCRKHVFKNSNLRLSMREFCSVWAGCGRVSSHISSQVWYIHHMCMMVSAQLSIVTLLVCNGWVLIDPLPILGDSSGWDIVKWFYDGWNKCLKPGRTGSVSGSVTVTKPKGNCNWVGEHWLFWEIWIIMKFEF